MPNGKPGDDPYLDMVSHGLDLGEPKIAARLRALHRRADPGLQRLLSDLVDTMVFRSAGIPEDQRRDRMNMHLDTIERLIGGRNRSNSV